MENSFAFSIQVNGDDSTELQQQVATALINAEIPLPKDDPWQLEAPPEGAFGFSEGVFGFVLDAWIELIKLPKAVRAVANGISEFLKNRANTTLMVRKADGTVIVLKANMDGDSIVETLKQI